jgi:hypothetical protein
MQGSGSRNRALVMRSGADSEMTSGLSGAEVDIIRQAPGLARNGQNALASAEIYVIIDLPKKLSDDRNLKLALKGKVVSIEMGSRQTAKKNITVRFESKYIIAPDGGTSRGGQE